MSTDKPTFSEKAKLYIEYRELIDDIQQTFDREAQELFDYITNRIKYGTGRLGASARSRIFREALKLEQTSVWKQMSRRADERRGPG